MSRSQSNRSLLASAKPPDGSKSPSAAAVVMRPIGELRPYAGNARTHSKKQIRQIASSIERFGFTNPVLIVSVR